jgi:hypothetical protein
MTATFANSLWPRRACKAGLVPGRSCPEALGSPAGYHVPPGHRLLWPHPSHLQSSGDLFPSSAKDCDRKWVPNLSCESVRACHPQYPGGPRGCKRQLLPHAHWSSLSLPKFDIHIPCKLVHAWRRNEAVSGSQMLRPARWLALHQQGRLLPSFHRPSHLEPTSAITTWTNCQFPGPDFHRLDSQPYGLRAKSAKQRIEGPCICCAVGDLLSDT